MKSKSFLILGLVCMSLAAPQVWAQTREIGGAGELLDRIAVIVNDGVVLESQITRDTETITQRLREQNTPLPAPSVLRTQIIERLVLQEIQMQRAQKLGLKVSEEALNGALKDIADQNHIPFTELPQALAKEHINYAEYREQMRREMTQQVLRQRDVFARIYVSPRELDQYLARQSVDKSAEVSYNLSHILLSLPSAASAGQLEAIEKRANEIAGRAQKGEDFGQLAVAYSQAQTALERGSIGWRKGNELPEFMADAVVKLKPGEVSNPIRTPSGYHIIKLNERKDETTKVIVPQVHARHILIKTNELQDDETVRSRLAAIRERIQSGKEEFAAVAKAVSEDPGSAVEGGDLGWSSPGSFVPEFENKLAELKDNQISEPFHTQYGWHIVQRLGERVQDMSDEDRRHKAFEKIRASRVDEEIELWLRHLRDEAFIDYRN
jgi:peptidyl-prolyl cis-trans isomerase SurA